MNIGIKVQVGDVVIKAYGVDVGPDACGDLLAQAVKHMLELVDREACIVAARGPLEDVGPDPDGAE